MANILRIMTGAVLAGIGAVMLLMLMWNLGTWSKDLWITTYNYILVLSIGLAVSGILIIVDGTKAD